MIDASFSVVRNGEQVNVHASGRAPMDRMECNVVGQIKIEVVTPMKKHRITVDAPEHAIRADVTFEASSLPYEEPPFLVRAGNRKVMSYTRLTQLGTWTGWIEVDGIRTDLLPNDIVGSRDRSWGVRGVGERIQLGAPLDLPPQFYWLWAPVWFDGFGTVFDVNEFADGQRWHESGAMLIGADTIKHAHSVSYDYSWEHGTRRSEKFELKYEFAKDSAELVFTPLVHFQMNGLGYLHPEWNHGNWKGESVSGGDRFTVPVEDPLLMHNLHTQTLSSVSCTMSDGTIHNGIGILETLVLGAHAPSGFTGISDGYSKP